ncbi:SDR family NAD(P)-dependent oxidoreductase [Cognatishimia sp. F0-27]|uniref:SDR family NAD(P)-dependent oxidoreductase n=1 Tax=Cognatishimia sp. F0-27 TaxID=2816855 RepID=UPI001D0C8A3C|nr:SDR family oxidoreductase [Cognatishimia sp. F0-27]MCC1493147.1 SDR family oxidoreductase [Cognatishimia sp. F0-27]
MIDLSGRQALVTGGARGLGRAIADQLAAAGAEICVVDLATALDTAPLPEGWRGVALDLTGAEAGDGLNTTLADLGRLDILVANAGAVPPWRRVADLEFGEWDAVFALNVRAVAQSLSCAAPYLARSDCGSAVLMASINGYRAHPDQTLYTTTKHAVLGLMRAAALDLGRDGVRVNALAPGPILTDALRGRIEARADAGGTDPEKAIAALNAETALGRIATEEDVARAACFLASDMASGITGTCLPVEAGLP